MFGDPNLFPVEPYTGQKYRVKEQEPSKFIVEWSEPIKRFHWFGKVVGERWFPVGMALFYIPCYKTEERAQEKIQELEARDQFTPKVIMPCQQ